MAQQQEAAPPAAAPSDRAHPQLRLELSLGRRKSIEAASSVCDTSSDLSALASPFAYAERLRERLERHVLQQPGSSEGADLESPVTAEATAEQLDWYLDGHSALKRRAGEYCIANATV
jgi:hypothetical protein